MFFFWRFFQIILVVLKYGVLKRGDKPKRLRLTLEELSGAFIKLGQIMSMRFDLLPPEYCFELIGLLDKVSPLSKKEVDKVFLKEFKKKPDKIFASFDYQQIASASFGQVHLAYLISGEKVAVKIQRPGIQRKLKVDILFLKFIAWFCDVFNLLKALSFGRIVKEFKKWSYEEIDYEIEANNTEDLRTHILKYPTMIAPKIFQEYTTKRVLTEEFLEGISLSSIISRPNLAAGIDLKQFSELLLYNCMTQYFIEGVFQADPHPANILILAENKIGFIDLGITGHVNENRVFMADCIRAVGDVNYAAMAEAFSNLSLFKIKLPTELLNQYPELQAVIKEIKQIVLSLLTAEFKKITNEWYAAIENPQAPTYAKSAALSFLKLVQAASKYHIRLPADVILFIRALVIIDMVALRLDPTFNLSVVIKRFFNENKQKIDEIKSMIIEKISQDEKRITIKLFQPKPVIDKEILEKYLEWILYFAAKHKQIRDMLPEKLRRLI